MSSATRQQRIEELFLAASELDTDARRPYLEKQCRDDPELRKEVESLLTNAVDDDFLDSRDSPGKKLLTKIGVDLPVTDEPTLPPGTRINSYTLRGVIGSGGMGVVYVGEQEMPRRTVAIKLVRAGGRSERMLRRFEYEAEVLGKLAHPGIAQIYEAGRWQATEGPRPFIAMEYVRGLMLTQHVDRGHLPVRERLELMAKVADAVQHAHRCGVIHRDLKPANILVGEDGQPKILDFGVARALNTDNALTTMQTGVGQIIGTLPYMSPEQVSGDAGGVDTRTDVYALGVLLFEILTGRLPHDLKSRPIAEAARIICDEPHVRLSTIDRTLRGDIETIVVKALDKDRTRRYQSAAELADDIRRYLKGEPILAKHDSAFYILRKQLTRYRHAVAAGVLFVVALIAFSTYAWYQREQAVVAWSHEAEAGRRAEDQRKIAVHERERADAKSAELRQNLYGSAIAFAQASYYNADVERMKRVLADCPADLRGWEWRYLNKLSDTSELNYNAGYEGMGAWAVSFDSSKTAAWMGPGFPVRIYDAIRGRELHCIDPVSEAPMSCAFSMDGKLFAIGNHKRQSVSIYDTATGVELARRETRTDFAPLAFTPGGRMLGITSAGGVATGWALVDPFDPDRETRLSVAGISSAWLSQDGTLVLGANTTGMLWVWDATSGELLRYWRAHDLVVLSATTTPDSSRIVTASSDKTVKIWDWQGEELKATIRAHDNKVWSVSVSPSGREVASVGTDLLVRVSDIETGAQLRTYAGHENTVVRVQFGPDGQELLTAAKDGTFRRWLSSTSGSMVRFVSPYLIAGEMSPDGSSLFVGDSNGIVYRWSPATAAGAPIWQGKLIDDRIAYLTISRDGAMLAVCGGTDRAVRVFRTRDMSRIATLPAIDSTITGCAFSPDGQLLAVCGFGGEVIIVEITSGKTLLSFKVPGGLSKIAWHPGGRLLVVSGLTDYSLRVWDIAPALALRPGPVQVFELGKPAIYSGATSYTWCITFTPDGNSMVCGSEDSRVYVWNLATGGKPRVISGHKGPVYSLQLNADASRMVSGSWDNNVRVWDFRTGQEYLVLRGHIYAVWMTRFAPDDSSVISVGNEGEVRWWGTTVSASRGTELFE
jgi:WD40 repeat protein/predicted Ser/Thr protein kinase